MWFSLRSEINEKALKSTKEAFLPRPLPPGTDLPLLSMSDHHQDRKTTSHPREIKASPTNIKVMKVEELEIEVRGVREGKGGGKRGVEE